MGQAICRSRKGVQKDAEKKYLPIPMPPDYLQDLAEWTKKVSTAAVANLIEEIERIILVHGSRFAHDENIREVVRALQTREVNLDDFALGTRRTIGARLILITAWSQRTIYSSAPDQAILAALLEVAINEKKMSVRQDALGGLNCHSILMQAIPLINTMSSLFLAILRHSDVNHEAVTAHPEDTVLYLGEDRPATAVFGLCSRYGVTDRFSWIQQLKLHGANLGATDAQGMTILHWLVHVGDWVCLEKLFSVELFGIDWMQREKRTGWTFIDAIRVLQSYSPAPKPLLKICDMWIFRCKTFTHRSVDAHLGIPDLAKIVVQFLFNEPGELTDDDLEEILQGTQSSMTDEEEQKQEPGEEVAQAVMIEEEVEAAEEQEAEENAEEQSEADEEAPEFVPPVIALEFLQ